MNIRIASLLALAGLGVPRAHAAPARVVVSVEWTTETRAAERISPLIYPQGMGTPQKPGPELFTERGNVRIVMDMEALALPGGPMSRQVESAGAPYQVGTTNGAFSMPAGGGTLVSVTGDVAYNHTMDESGVCTKQVVTNSEMAGTYWNDAAKYVTTATHTFTNANTMLSVRFKGGQVVGMTLGSLENIVLKGRITYACPGSAPLAQTEDLQRAPGTSVSMDFSDGLTYTRSTSGQIQTIVGKSDTKDARGFRVVRTVTMTWSAPSGPVTPPVVTAPPAVSTGTITFTQGGKQATWKLAQSNVQGAMGTSARVMVFTPSGGMAAPGAGIMTLMVLESNGTVSVGNLTVEHGPGGDGEYDMATGGCRISTSKPAGGGMLGNGTCAAGFSGVAVTKFDFTVAR